MSVIRALLISYSWVFLAGIWYWTIAAIFENSPKLNSPNLSISKNLIFVDKHVEMICFHTFFKACEHEKKTQTV